MYKMRLVDLFFLSGWLGGSKDCIIILTTFTMMKNYWQVEGVYLLFVVLWGWAETAETYLYLSYPFITPSPNTRQPEMLTSSSNFLFKAWEFGPCTSDMLSDSIPSLTRNLKSILSCSYFLRQSAFCPFNVYFSKETYFHLKKKKDINPMIHTYIMYVSKYIHVY